LLFIIFSLSLAFAAHQFNYQRLLDLSAGFVLHPSLFCNEGASSAPNTCHCWQQEKAVEQLMLQIKRQIEKYHLVTAKRWAEFCQLKV